MYRYDASYAVEVQKAHPGRFGLVKPVDPDDPAVAEIIAEWKTTPGAVGVRIMMPKEAGRDHDQARQGTAICRSIELGEVVGRAGVLRSLRLSEQDANIHTDGAIWNSMISTY